MTNVEIISEKLGALNKGKENSNKEFTYRPPDTPHTPTLAVVQESCGPVLLTSSRAD